MHVDFTFKLKYCFFSIALGLCTLLSFGQRPAEQGSITISGKITNTQGKLLEGASVVAWAISGADTLKTGTSTDKSGDFRLQSPPAAIMKLEVSMVGYETITADLGNPGTAGNLDAGTLTLAEKANALAAVTVVAKKPFMQMGVDRRTFNADAVVIAKGGTAVDLLRNIPGLNVDVNGGVELRNSTPQIFVDGRPTLLSLEQIPSDDIERVEVITNPSARYDAGSTGGILNIILKKNRRRGFNGNLSLGAGTPGIALGNMSLNYRQGKINFFVSGGYNRRGGIADSEADRTNKSNGVATGFFRQESNNDRLRSFSNIRFGIDYFMDEFNSVSISKDFNDGRFGNNEQQQQYYYNAAKELTQTGLRTGDESFGYRRNNLQVNYRRTFEKQEKEWTADFTWNGGNNGGSGDIINRFFSTSGVQIGPDNVIFNEGDGTGNQFTFQTDYVNPLSEVSKLEMGARFFSNQSRDRLNVFSIDGATATKLPLSNHYSFEERIFALYGNYSNAFTKKWKYQAGLRYEQSVFKGELIDSAQQFGYKYPGKNTFWNAFFPSLFLTHTVKEGTDIQINFSRRIRRPNFWQINPYVDITDPQNIRRGNPTLQPEFTNSFEVNYSKTYEKGNVFVSLYFRNNTEDITQYTDTITADQLSQLNNAAIAPNALISTFINADRTNRTGLELTWQHKFNEAFDITPNFNAQYRDVKARVNDLDLSNTGFNWNFRTTANYKIITPKKPLFNNIAFQLQGEYESPRVLPQGRTLPMYGFDFALKKDFLKNNAATLTFNINDVLNSRRMGSITETESFEQEAYRRWNVRNFRLTFSYRFGNKDLQIFKRREDRGEGEG